MKKREPGSGTRLIDRTVALLLFVGLIIIAGKLVPSRRATVTTANVTLLDQGSPGWEEIRENSNPIPAKSSLKLESATIEASPARVVLTHSDFHPIELADTASFADEQINAITRRTDLPERFKARTLIAMLPSLSKESLARAAAESATRLPDADYAAVLLPTVRDPRTHEAAMSIFFADLMERPDAIALPALLTIARQPAHAFSSAARENLELLLDADFKDDWQRWEFEILHRLAAEP